MSKIGVLALYTFYHLYCELCDNAQISPSRAATEIGFNRATVTTWKNTGNAPKGELLSKIAKYFDVPTDFLLGLQPFNDWENINANRKKFIDESHIDSKLLSAIWKINSDEPETASLSSFIKFVNEAIVSAEIGSDGAWAITVKENFKGMTAGAQLKLGKKNRPRNWGRVERDRKANYELRSPDVAERAGGVSCLAASIARAWLSTSICRARVKP